MFSRLSITIKIIGITAVAFLMMSVCLIFIGQSLLDSDEMQQQATDREEVNIRVVWALLDQISSGFYYIRDDKIYAGSQLLNGNTELINQIVGIIGGTATIYMHDTRVATNLTTKDDNRAIGTKLEPGPIYTTVLEHGKPYRGEAQIFGEKYFVAYDPIKDSGGAVIGMLATGVKKTEFFSSFSGIISMLIYIIIGFGLLLCVVNYFATQLLVTTPVKQAMGVLKMLSKGDLRINLHYEEGDEITELYNSFYAMQDKLTEVIRGIRSSSKEVGMAADQVSQGNTTLSQRTQEQASTLEEVASSMEEMTGTVEQNAENASKANQLAREARDQAEQGGQVTNRAVGAMDEINSSSKKIEQIINVIDEIAFQTNLLALNAAVEAARAGDQGRGFAVVANEVRNLAGRSKTAAKEIKDLIEDSLSKVKDGTKLVDESKHSLDEIVVAVKKVSEIIAEIAAASNEQSQGIGQVNKALSEMDGMTQQNASLVEEAAAAAESMSAQAAGLTDLVEYFKLQGSDDRENAEARVVEEVKERHEQRAIASERKGALPRPGKEPAHAADDSDWEEF